MVLAGNLLRWPDRTLLLRGRALVWVSVVPRTFYFLLSLTLFGTVVIVAVLILK
jgi:hypothetical protein